MRLRQVPKPESRDNIIMSLHAELGHVGQRRTIDALSQLYWWHGMTVDVKRNLSTCKSCRRAEAIPATDTHHMQTEPHDDYGMFYRWGLDYLGELPPSASGNRYALIFIDYFSKWIEVFPVPKADAETTTRIILLHLVARYGVPAEIICDNGPPFKGMFEAFCVERGINQRFITPGRPQSNGLAERAVKTVKRALQKHAAWTKGSDTWDTEALAGILLGYRCTVQSSTQLSPAQVLFAQDPAVNADKWIAREPALSYEDAELEANADELLQRSQMATALRIQVAENLRLAHARNVERFKALRSGLYQPKVHHFQPGDFVFVIPPGEPPGGALGMPARDEILKVVEVRPSGAIILENQGGRHFSRHVAQCVPCNLSNVQGTVHPELVKPSWDFPCTICGDHRKAHKMLLCDGCNLGFHTFCLPVPLDDVPSDPIWLCHNCHTAGITPQQVIDRRADYIPAEESRPRIELPAPTRRDELRELAAAWHNKVVKHVTQAFERYGRVTFTKPNVKKYFRIFWSDGTESYHDKRILARLEVITPEETPEGIKPAAPAVRVWTARAQQHWSVQTPADIQARLQQGMPGQHSEAESYMVHNIVQYLGKRRRIVIPHDPSLLDMLNAAIDMSKCSVILDPWAGSRAVSRGLHLGTARLHLNELLSGFDAPLSLEPMEHVLYEQVRGICGRLDAIVMCPPLVLADMAFINALQYAGRVVCMLIHDTWLAHAHDARFALLARLEQQSRIIFIRDSDPSCTHDWVCVFADSAERDTLFRPGMDPGPSNLLLLARNNA